MLFSHCASLCELIVLVLHGLANSRIGFVSLGIDFVFSSRSGDCRDDVILFVSM